MGEQNLQKANQSLGLNEQQIEIGKALFHVNQLIAYPLTDLQIIDWSKTITRLMPEVTPAQVMAVIDEYMLENIEWDKSKGIQNIFYGLKPRGYSPDETN
jgi:hypothetical protein